MPAIGERRLKVNADGLRQMADELSTLMAIAPDSVDVAASPLARVSLGEPHLSASIRACRQYR
jgi:hypothetical protein